ncbi:hypothetical protein MAR_031524 [Mya arenaria]|uniref:Uncharacterized protein n=1 Tax=Mya arenaria TaxID=6604 RepID=A0ABY7F555_MYAAR|nr:hypothetical protein MAR_031524 [Mya arenaria]
MEELVDRIGEDVEAHKRDYDAQKAEILQQQQQVDEAFKTEDIPYLLYIPMRDIPPNRTHSIEDIIFAHLENEIGYQKQNREKLERGLPDSILDKDDQHYRYDALAMSNKDSIVKVTDKSDRPSSKPMVASAQTLGMTHRAEIRDNVRSHQMDRPIENIPIRTQESSINELVIDIERHIEDTTRLHQELENKAHVVATYMEEFVDRIGEDVEAHKQDYDAQKAEILKQQKQVDEAFRTGR